jgi:hypothetical protein
MSPTNYYFKQDFWGNWRLVPRNNADGPAGFFVFIIVLGFIIFMFCLALILSPLIFSLIGFTMVKNKQYIAGIASLLGFIYFLFDLHEKWISKYFFYGYTGEKGEFVDGLFGTKYIDYCWALNSIGVLLGVYFIVKFYLDKKNGVI